MFLAIYTLLHVALSLAGIVLGCVVMFGLLTRRSFKTSTSVFLVTTIATNVTGFGFPFVKFLPSHGVAILSLVLLTFTVLALYRFRLAGAWRVIYVVTATLALYFNVFVLVIQSFEKIDALKALAPTQSEPPFAITQLAVLALFLLMAILAVIRFPGDTATAAGTELPSRATTTVSS
jgi:hypothetical protein